MDAPTIKRHQRAKVEVGRTLERFATRSPTTPEREVFATASLRSSLAQVVRFGRACLAGDTGDDRSARKYVRFQGDERPLKSGWDGCKGLRNRPRQSVSRRPGADTGEAELSFPKADTLPRAIAAAPRCR